MLSLRLCWLVAFAYLFVAAAAGPKGKGRGHKHGSGASADPSFSKQFEEALHALEERVTHIEEAEHHNGDHDENSVHIVFHSDEEHAAAHAEDDHHTVVVNIQHHGDDHHDDDDHKVHHYKDGHHEWVGHCQFDHVSDTDFSGYAHMIQDKGETEAHIYFDVEYTGVKHVDEDIHMHFHEYAVHDDQCGDAGDEFHPNGPIKDAFVGHLHIGADNQAHQWNNHSHLGLFDYHADGHHSLFGRSILVTHGPNDEIIGCCNIGHASGDHGSLEEVEEDAKVVEIEE